MSDIKFYDSMPEEAAYIRKNVFIEEQGFQNEFDEVDSKAVHALIFKDGKAVGTARMYEANSGKSYFLGRIAVLKEYRRFHLGSKIVSALCEKAKELGAEYCEVSAQCRVMDFYKSLGFEESGESYLDENCPHIHMEKSL